MCEICDGKSPEEARQGFIEKIDTHGWAIRHIDASPTSQPWSYTVGLIDRYGHPELLNVGLTPEGVAAVFHELVAGIERGERYQNDGAVELQCGCCRVHFGTVHAAHVNGPWRCHSWFDVYDARGDLAPQWSALQVRMCCDRDAAWLPVLDEPEAHFPILDDLDLDAIAADAADALVRRRRKPRGR